MPATLEARRLGADFDLDELSKRAWRGCVRMQLMLALMLFLPAWSLRYWQAWVYWLLFCAGTCVMTLYLLRRDPALVRRRLEVGPAAETRPRQRVIQGIAGAMSVAVVIVPGMERHWHALPVPLPLVWTGDAVLAIALLALLRVFRENSYAASTVGVEPDQPVVGTGPYAWVRHPMYTASIAGFIATPLALGSQWALLPALLACAAIVLRLLDEEHYLLDRLPGYTSYCARVPYRLLRPLW
jgi:protein-S-isoprenylcysteine O-methyltransferase Ste14